MPRPPKDKDKMNKDKEPKQKKVKRYNKLRGFKDILFDEIRYFDLVTKKANDLAAVYSFKRIETPVLEDAELYERSTGRSSDIVTKEMYNFIDKNGEKVAMRPEGTPGMVRAYVEHGMFNLPQPVKMYAFPTLFRHEKPQSGRYRQHTQFDVEMFGEESPVADAQIILMAYNFYKELQVNVQIQINSIGCKECRQNYTKALLDFYKERGKRTKLCNDCKKRIVKNPMRLLDCKEDKCIEIRSDAPQIVDSLCDPCRDHFIKVLEHLDELDVMYVLNPYLVRGLDYYNRTVFEIWPVNSESGEAVESEEDKDENNQPVKRQSALGGGGRYDDLVEQMGGRPTPACGFGIGLERAVMKIKENNIPLKAEDGECIFIAQLGDQPRKKAMAMFEDLRRAGIKVRQAFTKNNLKTQLEEADRLGAKYTLIIGQKELMDGTILIRDMESGIQEVVDAKKIKQEMEKRITANQNSGGSVAV